MSAGEGVTILQGDCRETLKTLPAESVHCCVTSPPYWGLRDYGTGTWEGGEPKCDHRKVEDAAKAVATSTLGGGKKSTGHLQEGFKEFCGKCGARRVDHQIGLEPTPEAHVAALLGVFREVWRVLRKDGQLWLNYGDCYACAPNGRKAADIEGDDRAFRDKPFSTVSNKGMRVGWLQADPGSVSHEQPNRSPQIGLKPKDLVGMPWRVALALQADGWWLRSDIIWSKRNPMPESVTDRPTRAHEYLFLLAKAERYYYDADAIREASTSDHAFGNGYARPEQISRGGRGQSKGWEMTPLRNRRTVWEINTQPTPEAHFATFPEALVEPCIMAGTSDWGCCPECGAPWARVSEVSYEKSPVHGKGSVVGRRQKTGANGYDGAGMPRLNKRTQTTGWRPTCRHPYTDIELVPAVVLDPFAGSGTVARVASRLGRRSLLCELNPEYIDIAHRRTAQRGLEL